jgi:hypothetical protein
VEQEVRRVPGVGEQPHHQSRGVVLLVVVAHERHRGPAGSVVVELVDLEGRHDPAAVRLLDEVLGGVRSGVPRVQEPVEDHHHGHARAIGELGDVVDDVDQALGIGHG